MKKRMMVKEGDIGCEFEVKNVVEDDLEWGWFVEEKYVEYKGKKECFDEFKVLVEENDDVEMVGKYVDYLKKKSEGIEGKWFVGCNGEYIVMVGIEFDSEDDEEICLENEDILK